MRYEMFVGYSAICISEMARLKRWRLSSIVPASIKFLLAMKSYCRWFMSLLPRPIVCFLVLFCYFFFFSCSFSPPLSVPLVHFNTERQIFLRSALKTCSNFLFKVHLIFYLHSCFRFLYSKPFSAYINIEGARKRPLDAAFIRKESSNKT